MIITQYIFSKTYTHDELKYFNSIGFKLKENNVLCNKNLANISLIPTKFSGISLIYKNDLAIALMYGENTLHSLSSFSFRLCESVFAWIDFKEESLFFVSSPANVTKDIDTIIRHIFTRNGFYIKYSDALKISKHLKFKLIDLSSKYDLTGDAMSILNRNGIIVFYDFYNSPFLAFNGCFRLHKPSIINKIFGITYTNEFRSSYVLNTQSSFYSI